MVMGILLWRQKCFLTIILSVPAVMLNQPWMGRKGWVLSHLCFGHVRHCDIWGSMLLVEDGEFHNLGQVTFNLLILNFTFWKDHFTIGVQIEENEEWQQEILLEIYGDMLGEKLRPQPRCSCWWETLRRQNP